MPPQQMPSPPVPPHMMSNGNDEEQKKKSSDSSDTASASDSTSDDGAFDDFLAFLSKPPPAAADSPPIDIVDRDSDIELGNNGVDNIYIDASSTLNVDAPVPTALEGMKDDKMAIVHKVPPTEIKAYDPNVPLLSRKDSYMGSTFPQYTDEDDDDVLDIDSSTSLSMSPSPMSPSTPSYYADGFHNNFSAPPPQNDLDEEVFHDALDGNGFDDDRPSTSTTTRPLPRTQPSSSKLLNVSNFNDTNTNTKDLEAGTSRRSTDGLSEQVLLETFQFYDADGSGAIDVEELKAMMATLGHDLSDEQLSIMINDVDKDGNGLIDYREFVALFQMEVPDSNAFSFRGEERVSERRRASITSSLLDSIDTAALSRFVIEETWNDAKQLISFNGMLQIVTWLYSQRKMILLACSHFVATVIIWSECTTHLETALTYVNTCLTTHISFYIFIYLVSPLLYCQVTMRW